MTEEGIGLKRKAVQMMSFTSAIGAFTGVDDNVVREMREHILLSFSRPVRRPRTQQRHGMAGQNSTFLDTNNHAHSLAPPPPPRDVATQSTQYDDSSVGADSSMTAGGSYNASYSNALSSNAYSNAYSNTYSNAYSNTLSNSSSISAHYYSKHNETRDNATRDNSTHADYNPTHADLSTTFVADSSANLDEESAAAFAMASMNGSSNPGASA